MLFAKVHVGTKRWLLELTASARTANKTFFNLAVKITCVLKLLLKRQTAPLWFPLLPMFETRSEKGVMERAVSALSELFLWLLLLLLILTSHLAAAIYGQRKLTTIFIVCSFTLS